MTMFRKLIFASFVLCLFNSCESQTKEAEAPVQIENPTNEVVLRSEIVWQVLNPARGDQSPQAGTIWGDRNGEVATGFLAKFVDGFSSPPHIHNVTYRAVVIDGLVHNDDPDAANMWMPPGSFWTQPAGEAHITSAKGKSVLALVEIDQGPYLVKPTEEASDNGEKPINIDVTNLVWLKGEETNFIAPYTGAEMSFLLNDAADFRSLFVKLPAGFKGLFETTGSVMHAVVIQGELDYTLPQNEETKSLDEGSYFSSKAFARHQISNKANEEVLIYFRTNGNVTVK